MCAIVWGRHGYTGSLIFLSANLLVKYGVGMEWARDFGVSFAHKND